MRNLAALAIALAFSAGPAAGFAAMQSGSYQIIFDSLNSGGGLSDSASYSLESTVGEQATGDSAGTDYSLRAGYQQAFDETTISISSPADPSLGSVSGFTGGETSTTATWTITTDSPAGYAAYVRATSSPALRGPGGASFDDYSPSGADPDFTFAYSSTEAVFGFSPEGAHVVSRFRDDGASCNAGTGETSDRCYDGFTTTDALVASHGAHNSPSGTDLTLRLRAAVGSGKMQDSGNYAATVVVTAFAL